LHGLDTISAPIPLEIAITDDLGRSKKKTFFVHFIKIDPVIYVAYPVGDSMQTAASIINVLGNVTNVEHYNDLYFFARNNGRVLAKMVINKNKPVFSFEISLSGSSNHIALELYPDSLMNGSRFAFSHFMFFTILAWFILWLLKSEISL
jgi:hypothetical protein